MDARRSPEWVLAAHPANQVASLDRYPGSTATTMTGFPPPEEAEAYSARTDDRLRSDNDQGRAPVSPSGIQTYPEEPVRIGQLWSLHRAPQNVELVAQSKHLNLKGTHGPPKQSRTAAKMAGIAETGVRERKTLNSQCINQIGIYTNDSVG
jgi:hypothetical protein